MQFWLIDQYMGGGHSKLWGSHSKLWGSHSEALYTDLLTYFCLILHRIRHIYAPNCRKDMNG